MADLINYNRHTGLYDVPEAEFDAFIARRVEAIQAGNVEPVEMRRADGRILRYAGVVLPDGGRLLTYLDITDAKQREAELGEALEQQTATAEILRVISNSPTDVQPTLDAIAASATTLSGADIGNVARFDGSLIHLGAVYSWTGAQLDALQRIFPCAPNRGSVMGRASLTRTVVHIPDLAAHPESAHLPGYFAKVFSAVARRKP